MKNSIIASVLGADFSKLGDECRDLEKAGIDGIQWDVMDGQFVNNLTLGPDVISSIRPCVKTYFEAHLMVLTPEAMTKNYVEAGCERIIIHLEACKNVDVSIDAIRNTGAEVGVAINPETPANALQEYIDKVDMVLVMTVNPGWGGQSFIESAIQKIPEIRKMLDRGNQERDIEVDGGINDTTIVQAKEAGANLFVAGNYILKHPEGWAHAINELKSKL